MGVEGGHAIENSLGALRDYYALGVRHMTLTWNNALPWADSNRDPPLHNGLTPFGLEVVREMNRLGMLVDLSHASDSVMAQALRTSEAPVIFSHSSARALADHRRNVPDRILREVARLGGVVMVNFYCSFVDSVRINAAREGRPAPPRPPLSLVADHIEHIRDVAGVDHVGYGSDFDGIECAPQGLEDVSMFPRLTAELLRRGWSDQDAERVIGLNVLRVMRRAEAVAARLQRERRPSTATIAQLDSTGVR
jgi:membrane dipeptidase